MWKPKYTITNKLLRTIREIGESIGQLNAHSLSTNNLSKLELNAREISTFASTSIEGNPLLLTDVRRVLKTNKKNIRDTEREILNYNEALEKLYKKVEEKKFKINTTSLEEIQKSVTNQLLENPEDCGNLRTAPVLIRNPRKIHEVVFIPPDAKDIKNLMDQLMEFIKKNIDNIDPIILSGIFHKQCVIIHPFIDGNGRSTRLFTTGLLGTMEFNLFKIFSFENYYNNNISKYFKAVGLEGDYYELKNSIDFTYWLEYFSEGILDELKRVIKTIPSVQNLSTHRLESHHYKIIDFINEKGSITQREYANISTRSLAARKLDFEKLKSIGLIKSNSSGRGIYYTKNI